MYGNPPKTDLAYIVGVALGDGNLSNPNGRATRLRITCDARYPLIANEMVEVLRRIFPTNRVSLVRPLKKDTYFNISVYSNKLNEIMPWKVGAGSKLKQKARVPDWIKDNKLYSIYCLKGLLQTDGSIYRDRTYLMVNFTNYTQQLAEDVFHILENLGFRPTMSTTQTKNGNIKYCVRLARNPEILIKKLNLFKA